MEVWFISYLGYNYKKKVISNLKYSIIIDLADCQSSMKLENRDGVGKISI